MANNNQLITTSSPVDEVVDSLSALSLQIAPQMNCTVLIKSEEQQFINFNRIQSNGGVAFIHSNMQNFSSVQTLSVWAGKPIKLTLQESNKLNSFRYEITERTEAWIEHYNKIVSYHSAPMIRSLMNHKETCAKHFRNLPSGFVELELSQIKIACHETAIRKLSIQMEKLLFGLSEPSIGNLLVAFGLAFIHYKATKMM